MSAVTTTRSPIVRLIAKRPQSTSGRTLSMITFLVNDGFTAPFSAPVMCAPLIVSANLLVSQYVRHSCRRKQSPGERPKRTRRRCKVLNNQSILEIYHMGSGVRGRAEIFVSGANQITQWRLTLRQITRYLTLVG